MNRIVRLSAIALAMSSVSSLALGAPFTPGNLAVARVGTGSGALSAVASAVFIDEYTTSGTLVQSIPLPTADSGANQTLTVAGSSTSEAMLTLSTDARYLVMTGYDAAPGTGAVAGTTSAATNRIVGRIDATGAVDTSTGFTSAFNTSNIRAAASVDGSGIWTGGTGAGGTGGIWYQTFGTIGAGTQVSTTVTNTRNLGIFASQLYTTASSGAIRLASVGLGLPTTTGQLMSNLSGLPTASGSPYGFVVLDRSPSVAGVDTIYYADDATGLQKYSTGDGLNWTARGSVAGNMRGLTARIDSGTGNVILFGTSTTTSANALVTLTDTAAFDATISATPSNIATAATNTVFRGVAFVPSAAATPELSIAGANVAEGNTGCGGGTTPLNFTVTATVAPLSALTFNFATSDGSATAGSDYTGVMAGTGTINAGQTTGTATVQVSCDNRVEANETFTASLTAGVGYTISATNGSATGTISNDEVVAARISDVTQAEGTAGGTTAFNFTVSLDSGVEAGLGGISMLYTVDAAGATPGTDGVDFLSPAPEPGLFTIPDGSNSATLTVQVGADSTDEPNETFAVTLSNIVTGSIVDATGDGTITNDDSVIPVISISNVSVTEGDAGGPAVNAVFTVSIVPAPTGTVTVNADTANDSALSTSDYTSTSATLNFDNANTTRQFTVPITNDCTIESSEQFFVNLSGLTGTATIGDNQGVGTITDNDVAITASIAFLTPSANEGDTSTNTRVARVSLSQAMQCGDFTYSVSNTGGTATAGNDYQAVSVSNQTISGATTTADINVTVNGDLFNEVDETIQLTLSGSGANVTINPSVATATLVNDDQAPMTIEQIQGTGFTSPVATQTVTTANNIVTAVLPAPNGGFVMQMRDADASADAASSNGILVFTGATPTVQIGDEVIVKGQVVEFGTGTAEQRVTEYTNSGLSVAVTSSGNALPAPIVLDANRPSPNPATPSCGAGLNNFECIEFMRVTTSTGMINLGNQTFGSDPVAEMWITTSGARAFREGGLTANVANETPPTLTPPAPPLPSAYLFDQNPEVFEIDMDRAGLPNTVYTPGTTFSTTGVLAQEFNTYELFPTSFMPISVAPSLPTPVPVAAANQLTIGSANLHLLFDDQNDPWNATDCTAGDVDFCPDTARWNAKLNLLSRDIRESMLNPMVIGVQEVEKLGALQALAAKINADLGVGTFQYLAQLGTIDDLDGGHQNVGFLIRNDVTINSIEQLNTTQTWMFNGADQGEVMDRPPLLLRASVSRGGGAFQFAVMVVHQRSLSGIDDLSPLADQIDAHRVRQKRLYQAALTAQAIQSFRAANPTLPFFIVGDFNAFPDSDGYADVVGIIKGTTDPALSEYDLSFFNLQGTGVNGNIVDPPLVSGRDLTPADEQYSYQFNNTPQQIDHAMMGSAGLAVFDDLAFARGNVDQQAQYLIRFGNTLGTENPLVSSDHDHFVLYINAATDDMFANGFE